MTSGLMAAAPQRKDVVGGSENAAQATSTNTPTAFGRLAMTSGTSTSVACW